MIVLTAKTVAGDKRKNNNKFKHYQLRFSE
jgi:hypothetical protein